MGTDAVGWDRPFLEMRRAVEEDDSEALTKAAHSIYSNATMLGASSLASLCRDIERTAENGESLADSQGSIDAAEAHRIGLLNEVLPTEGFLDAAVEWCFAIARHRAGAVFAAKRAVVEGLRLPLDEGLKLEGRLFLEANASPEAREANAAIARPEEGGDSKLGT